MYTDIHYRQSTEEGKLKVLALKPLNATMTV